MAKPARYRSTLNNRRILLLLAATFGEYEQNACQHHDAGTQSAGIEFRRAKVNGDWDVAGRKRGRSANDAGQREIMSTPSPELA